MSTYRNFVQSMITTKLTGATIKALLVSTSYTYDEDAHVYLSSVTGELTASGYSRQTLSSVAISYNADLGVVITADDINFGTFTASNVAGPIFYIDSGSPSTSQLICADVEGDPSDLTSSVATIYRVDPDSGFLLARL